MVLHDHPLGHWALHNFKVSSREPDDGDDDDDDNGDDDDCQSHAVDKEPYDNDDDDNDVDDGEDADDHDYDGDNDNDDDDKKTQVKDVNLNNIAGMEEREVCRNHRHHYHNHRIITIIIPKCHHQPHNELYIIYYKSFVFAGLRPF